MMATRFARGLRARRCLGWIRRRWARRIGGCLPQPGFQLPDTGLQDRVLRAQCSVLQPERRPQFGRRRESALDHAVVVERSRSRGKATAEAAEGGAERLPETYFRGC